MSYFEYQIDNIRLLKMTKRLFAIRDMIQNNPGRNQSELRRIARDKKLVSSNRTFDTYIKLLRENMLVSFEKRKNRLYYRVVDVSLLEQIQETALVIHNKLMTLTSDLGKDIDEMSRHYGQMDERGKVSYVIELVHDILRPLNQVLLLYPLLNKKENNKFCRLKERLSGLLKRAVHLIASDQDANTVFPFVLTILQGERIGDMRPLLIEKHDSSQDISAVRKRGAS